MPCPDVISSPFPLKEGKTFWQTWKHVPELIDSLIQMKGICALHIYDIFPAIQKFFVIVYDRESSCTRVNDCRRELLCKGRYIENIPPTEDALLLHVKRATYQSGYIWEQRHVSIQNLPRPTDWGLEISESG